MEENLDKRGGGEDKEKTREVEEKTREVEVIVSHYHRHCAGERQT